MAKPGDEHKENSPEEEHLQDVSSDQENLDTTPTIQGGMISTRKSDEGGVARGGGASEIGKKMATDCKIRKFSIPSPSSDQIAEKKRVRRRLDPAASSSSSTPKDPEKPREKSQLVNVPSGPPRCYFCGKRYQSWKAVFGHLGKHKVGKERSRGVFPPPNFVPPRRYRKRVYGSGTGDANRQDALQEELTPILLNLAQQVLASSSSFRPDGLVIDLNRPDPHSLEEEAEGRFDLNKPPEEEEDGDDGENMDGDGLLK